MGWWKEVPFRGDGESRNSKPRKRLINLNENRREAIISILLILAIFGIPFGCLFVFGEPPWNNNTAELGSVVIGLVFLLTIAIGLVSFTKFRKGYDIEVSDEPEAQKEKSSNEHKNTID